MPREYENIDLKLYIDVGTNAIYPAETLYPSESLYPQGGFDAGIVAGTMSIDKLLSDDELRFGMACAAKMECDIYNGSTSFAGRPVWVTVNVDGVQKDLFYGKIEQCTKKSRYMDYYHVVAYDELAGKWDEDATEWWMSVTHVEQTGTRTWTPQSVETILTKLLTQVGMSLDKSISDYKSASSLFALVMGLYVYVPYRWDDEWQEESGQDFLYSTIVELKPTRLSYRGVLSMICELCAMFPTINAYGEVQLRSLGDTPLKALTLEDVIDDQTSSAGYVTKEFDGVILKGIGDSGIRSYDFVTGASNYYQIKNNLIIGSLSIREITQTRANALIGWAEEFKTVIRGHTYTPLSIEMKVTDYDLDIGQQVTWDGRSSYIFENRISSDWLLTQTISSEGSETAKESDTYDVEISEVKETE